MFLITERLSVCRSLLVELSVEDSGDRVEMSSFTVYGYSGTRIMLRLVLGVTND